MRVNPDYSIQGINFQDQAVKQNSPEKFNPQNNQEQAQTEPVSNVTEHSLIEAIEKANRVTVNHNTRAEFSVHAATKDIMVKIIDSDTNEVIREFPPKKFLDLIAKLWDLAGIVVDERR